MDDETLCSEGLPELRMHRKMHAILMSATLAIMRTLPTTASVTQQNALSPFINLFDTQFLDLAPQVMSPMSEHQDIQVVEDQQADINRDRRHLSPLLPPSHFSLLLL